MNPYRRLLRKTIAACVLAAGLVLICYFVVDRPVAFYVHDHEFNREPLLMWLTYPPPVVQAWVPAILAGLAARRAWGPFRRWERVLGTAGVSMVLADQFRESLSFVFGRYWPETWIDHNPSLIQDGAFGFHPFHSGSAYGSFPSGHAARTVGFAAAVWIAWPRWRWVCVAASAAVAIGLIGMNYHFVGDVIAGGFVGGIVGAYTSQCCGVSSAVPRS